MRWTNFAAAAALCCCIPVTLGYRAAVVQHQNVKGNDPRDTLMKNLDGYEIAMKKAADGGAQIVVFPEFSLFSPDCWDKCTPDETSTLDGYCEPVPDVGSDGTNPCDNSEDFADSPALVRASCMAKNNTIVASINTCELDLSQGRRDRYNTEVVFDETGKVIAKYRKYHVWHSECFTTPSKPEHVTFKTSFGVEFGVFTCFDIMFSEPSRTLLKSGIKHFVYSVEMPAIAVGGVLRAWSWKHSATLVAANFYENTSGVYSSGSCMSGDFQRGQEDVQFADIAA